MFWKKQTPVRSDEYEILIKKFATMESNLATMQSIVEKLETGHNNLRGIVNRKIGMIAKEEAQASESQDLNMLIPPGIGNGKILNPI